MKIAFGAQVPTLTVYQWPVTQGAQIEVGGLWLEERLFCCHLKRQQRGGNAAAGLGLGLRTAWRHGRVGDYEDGEAWLHRGGIKSRCSPVSLWRNFTVIILNFMHPVITHTFCAMGLNLFSNERVSWHCPLPHCFRTQWVGATVCRQFSAVLY